MQQNVTLNEGTTKMWSKWLAPSKSFTAFVIGTSKAVGLIKTEFLMQVHTHKHTRINEDDFQCRKKERMTTVLNVWNVLTGCRRHKDGRGNERTKRL